jgi:hypothetical protein
MGSQEKRVPHSLKEGLQKVVLEGRTHGLSVEVERWAAEVKVGDHYYEDWVMRHWFRGKAELRMPSEEKTHELSVRVRESCPSKEVKDNLYLQELDEAGRQRLIDLVVPRILAAHRAEPNEEIVLSPLFEEAAEQLKCRVVV